MTSTAPRSPETQRDHSFRADSAPGPPAPRSVREATAAIARGSFASRIRNRLSLPIAVVTLVTAIAFIGAAAPDARAAENETSKTAQAVDVAFVLDNSGSMQTNDPAFLTRQAVSNFAQAISGDESIDARLALVLFDSSVQLAQPLSPLGDADSMTRLSDALSALDFSGQLTNSPAGIERAIYELRENGREDARKAIVVISDGKIDTGDSQTDAEVARWLREDLAEESESNGIRIFGVAFTEAADYQLMQALARRTGARYYRAFEASELNAVVSDVLDRVDQPATYDLAYLEDPQPLTHVPVVPSPTAPAASEDDAFLSNRLLAWIPLLVLLLGGAALALHRRSKSGRNQDGLANEPAPPAQLLDLGGMLGEPGGAISLAPARSTIGRDPNNTIVIADDTVSSEHAVIENRDGRYWLQDCRSTNGTRIANKKIAPDQNYALKGGDRIRFADVDLMFVVEGYVPGGDTVYLKSSTTPPATSMASSSSASASGPGVPRQPDSESEQAAPISRPPPAEPVPPRVDIAAGKPPPERRAELSADDPDVPSQEIVFAEARERLDPASVFDLDDDLPDTGGSGSARDAAPESSAPKEDAEAVARAERALAAIEEDGTPPSSASSAKPQPASQSQPQSERPPQPQSEPEPRPETGVAALDAPTAEISVPAGRGAGDAERTDLHQEASAPSDDSGNATVIDADALRVCLDYHLDRVAEISPDFASFVRRAFQEELRTALPLAAKELIEQAQKSEVICQRAYSSDRIRYVVCGLPGGMSTAQKYFVEAFGGFTRVLTEQLQSTAFRQDRCEILALLSFGYDDAPWVSLSIVPDEGQTPRIDLLSYEFLTERERSEIEPKSDPQISQSGLA